MTIQQAINQALETGHQFRRAGWDINYPYKFVGLTYDKKLHQRYWFILEADDLLADDWTMVPPEDMDRRGNSWMALADSLDVDESVSGHRFCRACK